MTRDWRFVRAKLIGHAALGSLLGIYLLYLIESRTPGAPRWLGWGVLAGLWVAALLLFRRTVKRHRGDPTLPVPTWSRWVLAGALLFEAGTLLPMLDAWYLIGELNVCLVVLHFGMLLTAVLGGLSFLALRVPFRRRTFGALTPLLGAGFGIHWTVSTAAWAAV